jgi:hypothetical protein
MSIARALASIVVAVVAGALAAPARAEPGDAAMLSTYLVPPEKAAAFAEGYRKHVRWHLAARDPWAWYVWQVRTGPHRGHFVGGSFDHAWADLDRRPQPEADAADHRVEIDRHTERIESRYLVRRRDLGGTLPALETAGELVVIELRLAPGGRAAAETAARRLAALAAADARFGWFEVVVGPSPTLLLVVPLARDSDLGAAGLATVWRARAAAVREPLARLEAATASIESTLLGFRADLSSCLLPATRCVGAVPATASAVPGTASPVPGTASPVPGTASPVPGTAP